MQLLQLNMKPPDEPPVRRMTAGPDPFGSFRTIIGLLGVPLQFRIVSDPRAPDGSVRMSPGFIDPQSKMAVCAGMTRSAARAGPLATNDSAAMRERLSKRLENADPSALDWDIDSTTVLSEKIEAPHFLRHNTWSVGHSYRSPTTASILNFGQP
jgi:hypothetical protein